MLRGQNTVGVLWIFSLGESVNVDMTHIQYQGETLPHSPLPLVLAFHLVLGKFHI